MQKLTGFLFAALISVSATTAISTTASAGQSVWNHNGSQMLLDSNGNRRVISYLHPRPGISAQPGQMLFEGRRVGNHYEGTAYTFRRGCQPAAYDVYGQLGSETRIVLRGAAPKRVGCQIVGYSEHSGNARLVFTYMRKAEGQDYGSDTQEGPQAGPVQRIVKSIPGGKVIFRMQDQDEPAAQPIRIDITARCSNGQTIKIKTNYRACAFQGITTLPGGRGFILRQLDYDGQACSIPLASRIQTYDICQ